MARAPAGIVATQAPARTLVKVCETCGQGFAVRDDKNFRRRRFCCWRCWACVRGKFHPNSHHSPKVDPNGYRAVALSDEERARYGYRRRYVAEHVLIAMRTLGRRLKRGERVHHLNCDPSDNRRANLLICTQAYHQYIHGAMSRLWARAHFGRAI